MITQGCSVEMSKISVACCIRTIKIKTKYKLRCTPHTVTVSKNVQIFTQCFMHDFHLLSVFLSCLFVFSSFTYLFSFLFWVLHLRFGCSFCMLTFEMCMVVVCMRKISVHMLDSQSACERFWKHVYEKGTLVSFACYANGIVVAVVADAANVVVVAMACPCRFV